MTGSATCSPRPVLRLLPPGSEARPAATQDRQRDKNRAFIIKLMLSRYAAGYDDGYRRLLSNRGQMIVRGHFAPVVGRISMDMTLIDVTDVPNVTIDDYVTLLGSEGEVQITAEDLGELAGTISYEITCGISNRVPRIYLP